MEEVEAAVAGIETNLGCPLREENLPRLEGLVGAVVEAADVVREIRGRAALPAETHGTIDVWLGIS